MRILDLIIQVIKISVVHGYVFIFARFPNLTYRFLRLLLDQGFSYSLLRFLMGNTHYERGEYELAFELWNNSITNPFGLISTYPDFVYLCLSRFAELSVRYESLGKVREILRLIVQGQRSLQDIKPERIIGPLLAGKKSILLEDLSRLSKTFTPVYEILEIVDIESIAASSEVVGAPEVFQFCDPKVIGDSSKGESHSVKVPTLRLWTVLDCRVVDSFQVIVDGRLVLYEPGGHPKFGMVAGTWMNFMKISGHDSVFSVRLNTDSRTVESGILLSGRATSNYFHWLIEYLPRALVAKSVPEEVPFIVAKDLPPQFLESLQAIAPERKLVSVDFSREHLFVKKLYIPSFHTYLPDDYSVPFWEGGGFSRGVLLEQKRRIERWAGCDHDLVPSRRIYLDRAGSRSVYNRKKVIQILRAHGFEVVRTETLSFLEQVRMFNSAEVIIGSTGAAMASLLFMRPKTKILAFITPRNKKYALKSNIASSVDVEFQYLVGRHFWPRFLFRNDAMYAHSNFAVPIADLKNFLRGLDNE